MTLTTPAPEAGRLKCPHVRRLFLTVLPGGGVEGWCRYCKQTHLVPREEVLRYLLSEEEQARLGMQAAAARETTV